MGLPISRLVNALDAELNPICHLLALLGVHHFLHVSRIRVKSLTLRLLMSYMYDISSLRVKVLSMHIYILWDPVLLLTLNIHTVYFFNVRSCI